MKAVDITQIIQVVGPFIVQLVELILKYWQGADHWNAVPVVRDQVKIAISGGVFVDEHGVKFAWAADALDVTHLDTFIRGIIAAKRQAAG